MLKRLNQKLLWLVGVMLIASIVFGWYLRSLHNAAPDAAFTNLAGKSITLAELHGQPVLVAFWASDCRPCLEEIPDLAALQREFGPRGFHLIAVSMAYDLPSRVVTLVRELKPPYDVALDPLGKIAAAFGEVQQIPQAFLIAPSGRVARRILGKLPVDELRREIQTMLKEVG